ncbi:MAG: 4-(cytidine 5'-diphospho)-2-C-methyl-D-erythritol kinase [Rhizomicrobium sp.]
MIASDRVFVRAPAKINLCLHVGERRVDGYHDLESLAVFAAQEDGIWLERAEDFSLSVAGPFGAGLSPGNDNLAIGAARTLAERTRTRRGVRITLQKEIPLASGLGGGSADAAAVMRGLVRLWSLALDHHDLRRIAASIGADVPVCIDSATAWMEGRGERVTLLPAMPGVWLLLVNPRIAVPTAQVFAAIRERRGLGLRCPTEPFDDAPALVRFLQSTTNDLQLSACAIAPVIADVLDEIARLPGTLLARMSGSGATCFGLFENDRALRPALALLRERRPDWWLAGAPLLRKPAGIPAFVQ